MKQYRTGPNRPQEKLHPLGELEQVFMRVQEQGWPREPACATGAEALAEAEAAHAAANPAGVR